VISRLTHSTSGSEMEETLTSYRFYGLNIFEDYMWTYIAPP
jgi:hypothetical protein